MFPASSTQAGMCLGVPDVCNTPAAPSPLPIPYPNLGQLPVAAGFCEKVMILNMPAIVESSKIPMSQGDEPGVIGGVVSGVNMNEIVFKTYSSKCYAGGKKMVHVIAMTAHNGSSANMPAGTQTVPSQVMVLIG